LRREEDTLKEPKRTVYFATQNKGKYREAAEVAKDFGITLRHLNVRKLEIQSDSLTEIATYAAKEAANSTHRSLLCEDAGLFIHTLHGFPGPYSSYIFQTLGTSGVLELMKGVKDRRAFFTAAVAYAKPKENPVCFTGVSKGTISPKKRGTYGFGFDPIFIPDKGDGRSFAEMNQNEKNMYSHRAKAFAKFSRWFNPRRR
jgi:XTP/dITP diphosphohydrolase